MKKYTLSVLLIILCAVISATFRLGSSPRDEHDRVKIDSEWEIRFRDRKYNCTAPEKQRLSSVFPIKKGDHIELSTILPKYPFRQPEVEFTSQCSVVRVYLDRELIYSYGEQEEAKNRLVGSGRMCVPLPGDPYGKELTITLDVCENGMFTRVSEVYIQDTKYYIQNILRDNIWLLGVALLILAIGIVLLSIALIMTVMSNYKTRSVIYLSGFAISTAVWLLCYSGIALCVTDDYYFLSIATYICLYIQPIWFGLFASEHIGDEIRRNILRVCAAVIGLFNIISWLLNAFNIVHFPGTLKCYHVLMLADYVVCVVCVCMELKKD